MRAHTSGPWKYGVRSDGSIWLSLGDHSTGPHFQGDLVASEADARLICAAPDLLEALSDLLWIVEPNLLTRDATKDARAAIAKATGAP